LRAKVVADIFDSLASILNHYSLWKSLNIWVTRLQTT